jgi:hypothetical protein
MNQKFIKHLLECQCISPIYKKHTKIIYHKFQVFSEFDDEGNMQEKLVSCNNCNAIHKVYETCKSEILLNREDLLNLVNTKEDIIFNLKSYGLNNIVEILEKNDTDISIWEHVLYVYENKLEDHKITFYKQVIDEISFNIKYFIFKNNNFIIKKENINTGFKLI